MTCLVRMCSQVFRSQLLECASFILCNSQKKSTPLSQLNTARKAGFTAMIQKTVNAKPMLHKCVDICWLGESSVSLSTTERLRYVTTDINCLNSRWKRFGLKPCEELSHYFTPHKK